MNLNHEQAWINSCWGPKTTRKGIKCALAFLGPAVPYLLDPFLSFLYAELIKNAPFICLIADLIPSHQHCLEGNCCLYHSLGPSLHNVSVSLCCHVSTFRKGRAGIKVPVIICADAESSQRGLS